MLSAIKTVGADGAWTNAIKVLLLVLPNNVIVQAILLLEPSLRAYYFICSLY